MKDRSVGMVEDMLDDIMSLDDSENSGVDNTEEPQRSVDQSQPRLDCYPYSFTPLLLFTESSYFDKGHSNYNSVARFFQKVLPVDMLEHVLYDRKNMLYEELLGYIIQHEMLVVCCIDDHFTAFKVFSDNSLIYYDPCKPQLQKYEGDSFRALAIYLLLKCNYADSNHIQENKDHYTGTLSTSAIRYCIYNTWKRINTLEGPIGRIRSQSVPLPLKNYVLINDKSNPALMSTQRTSNTCYFQVFLFAVLVKVGRMKKRMKFEQLDALETVTKDMCRFLLEFFVSGTTSGGTLMRPLTNCNFVIDFYRYKSSPYFPVIRDYLGIGHTLDYEVQYKRIMKYLASQVCLHKYERFTLEGAMSSTPNTKSLQLVTGHEDAVAKLAKCGNYYKYRAANLMFGFNSNIMMDLESFCEFNALRKNQLLRFYDVLRESLSGCADAVMKASPSVTKYRDYYFMPQFEVGQRELVDVHFYTYIVDLFSLKELGPAFEKRIHAVNNVLVEHIFFSTQQTRNYEKFSDIKNQRKYLKMFRDTFLTADWFQNFVGLGFGEINPKEKEINSLTQTVFYSTDLMSMQSHRQSYEFEKECINQMARSTLRKYSRRIDECEYSQKYKVHVKIGHGHTYSKYNTLMHFLNTVECYWRNPDLSNIQIFGKDIRSLLAISCQKIFFDKSHSGFYHYGPFEGVSYRNETDLAVASSVDVVVPSVSQNKRGSCNSLVITDRVFEYHYLRSILEGVFDRAHGERFKSDNEVLNLSLLSLMLDFGLYEKFRPLLHLPFLRCLHHHADTRELQVEIANLIYEFDRKNSRDSVTRAKVEELIFESSYKFLVNKDFPVHSHQFKLIQMLNADPDYQRYVLLCKTYVSLCQINKSQEVDYYKLRCDDEFRIIIPQNYSKSTGVYLEQIASRYTFSERDNIMIYDDLSVFDLTYHQPEINLYKVRFDSATEVQSMVKYIEVKNVLRVLGANEKYLMFIADNVLLLDVSFSASIRISINQIDVEIATIFFNEAISFVPCFKYAESADVVFFTSSNIHYMIDKGGQFHTEYYGMKHELVDFISSEEVFVDLNDEHVFKSFKLSELTTESKVVLYFPDYILQVQDRQQLINMIDLAVKLRNVSFFILVLFYLRRCSVFLEYISKEDNVTRISGPWRQAILYVLRNVSNAHYESIFEKQFFDLNQHKNLPLNNFVDVLCENFAKYQRYIDGEYQIVPRPKQKEFLKQILRSKECFHFSEVGSGKTKVILPLLCQLFLSNNIEAHTCLARGGSTKNVLVILVPEHLVSDARTQVYRYCLNLNFREEYRVYDDIFALMHTKVVLGSMKKIFVTSFNLFKKALTYDVICKKVYHHRKHFLIIADEVDDFLDRNKLVFNICSNKNNSFGKDTLDLFYETSRAAYRGSSSADTSLFDSSANPDYWRQLLVKCKAIHAEIQDASRSINKSFGIFNEYTLRHSPNNAHDIEGYKRLIARPYESVNRAMPGSYYSDVERTIYLTYVILSEDIVKYDELFQAERKFISFEYWNAHFVHHLEYDDLVYGHEKLSEIVEKHPDTKDGLIRFLYRIILRRMEIREKSRSVNSIDIVFNFDCVGFTGTPFLDNYPTFDYIRQGREDDIPHMIDRSCYAYSSEQLDVESFEARFAHFQGQNCNVITEYVCSDDIVGNAGSEMEMLESIFSYEEHARLLSSPSSGVQNGDYKPVDFNVIVDLCGVFKRSTIHDIADMIKQHFGTERFLYVYHIDTNDNSDRVLCLRSENDVQYDEEFYKYMCNTYEADLRDKIFFFVDNRNVIGKDVPFQLVYQRHYGQPLFKKSVVLAHDVESFSAIWQAMGRSRTMNQTAFSIYKSGITFETAEQSAGATEIKKHRLTRALYIKNCDRIMAGNISSIYLTLLALYNLSNGSFYYCDRIVNVFLEKLERKLAGKVSEHEEELVKAILDLPVSALILRHILSAKFKRSVNPIISNASLTESKVESLLRNIVRQKYEQRRLSNDEFDEFILFLSGEQRSQMEISYTKQQQKQKTTQQNKNQDSDAMGVFDKQNRLLLVDETTDYFHHSLSSKTDFAKMSLNLVCSVPIVSISYVIDGNIQYINVYPTLQFMYSHHIYGAYITEEVHEVFRNFKHETAEFFRRFLETAMGNRLQRPADMESNTDSRDPSAGFRVSVLSNYVRQNPLYSISALEQGVYVIGMKDQFNIHDMRGHPLENRIQYITDDTGFVLFDKTEEKNVDRFGPYFIEQYILLEVLTKHEVAQNVIEYYCHHREILHHGLATYDEKQGKGFICWRFLMRQAVKNNAALGNGEKGKTS